MGDKMFDMNWPKKGDKAFICENAFSSSACAYLDWLKYRGSDYISMSFKEAADIIINNLETGKLDSHADIFFFPICYLYRHVIELELKAIMELGARLDILSDDDEYKKLQGSHSLNQLWNIAEAVLKDFYADEPSDDLIAAGSLIQQFHALDKTGQNFRYGKTKTGKSTLQNVPKIVDLVNLRKMFDGLYNLLTASQDGMSEALSNMESNY